MILQIEVCVMFEDFIAQVNLTPSNGNFSVDSLEYQGVVLPMDILCCTFLDKVDKAVLLKLEKDDD